MRLPLLVSCAFLCLLATTSFGQDSKSIIDTVANFPSNVLEKIDKKASDIEDKIVNYSEKALAKLEKQEEKLRKKLAKKDSLAAVQLFGDVKGKYEQLRQGLTQKENQLNRYKEYLPGFDTLKTSLNFLSQNSSSFFSNNEQLTQLKGALKSVEGLDEKLQGADAIRKYLKERRQQLKEQLGKFGLAKEFQKYNKQAYYYSQQIKEYQSILQDQDKLEQAAIGLLRKLPLFQKFMAEHSELAQLFPAPANYGTFAGLQGLQTRAEIQELMQSRIAAGGPNAGQMVQQNIQQAQQQLHQLKDKINKLGGSSSDFDMPDFKPNTQKTKSFWKRVEYGTNLQNTRSNGFIPLTTDLGLSIGYRMNDKASMGIGGSYRMGWIGKWDNLTLTHEGIGLRSYIDWKIKGSFFLSGGYEQNYHRQFDNLQQLKRADYWQQAGLIGLSKKYSIKKKWKGDIKLLYDFLYNTHTPVTQPVVFRFGYGF